VPAEPADAAPRRSVVPPAAAGSLWWSAAWTGLAPAVLGGVLGIAGVALTWLPASGAHGSAGSVLRAGVLTFLAALHGGITVDGAPAQFVPLGLTLVVAVFAARAGTGLADVAAELGEQPTGRLAGAAVLQAATFAAVCGIAARLSPLGTTSVNPAAAAGAAAVLFAATGSFAFARTAGLLDGLPERVRTAARAGTAALLAYVGAGALLVGAAAVVHRDRVELLSHQVGGGWSGVPVLLLGVLAVPNAAVAAAAYLAGPGFAVGHGSAVSLTGGVHGTLPAFPVLGALPTAPAGTAGWLLAAATPVAAGLLLVRGARDGAAGAEPWVRLAAALAVLAGLGAVAAWLAGGGIGGGRLAAIGASPWQFGLAVAGGAAAVALPSLAGLSALSWWRLRGLDAPDEAPGLVALTGGRRRRMRADGEDQLAG